MRSFKRLDKDVQKIIMDAAAKVEKQGWEQVRINAKQDTDSLAKNGIAVSTPTAELANEFNAIGKIMTQEWLDESGSEIKTLLENYQQ
jgi:TRAP-type C4-dicarboxylate transport system substrate-binding protein